MRLFYSAASPYARAVRIALFETGLASQVDMHLLTRGQLYAPESEVVAANPTGRVPTLVLDDGTALTESSLILEFIVAQTGQLSPAASLNRWQALAEAGRARSLLDGLTTWLRALPHAEVLAAVIEREQRRAVRTADAIERDIPGESGELDVTQITIGCALGLADARLAWTWRDGRPKLAEWYETLAVRESFAQTAPPRS